MFSYCLNNPCVYIDPQGFEGLVGIGFQFDISTAHGTYGIEIVIYIEPEVVKNTTNDESDSVVIVAYSYSGVSVDLQELAIAPQLYEMTSSLDLSKLNNMNSDELLIYMAAILSEFQLSAGLFLVIGYDNFHSAKDYSGPFDTWSASISKPCSAISGGAYYSYSSTCWAVGVKASLSSRSKADPFPVCIQYSRTYYSDPYILGAR